MATPCEVSCHNVMLYNWVLIAGGALVTVVSFVIGQRESLPKGRELEKRKDKNYSKSKAASGNSKLGCHQAAESGM